MWCLQGANQTRKRMDLPDFLLDICCYKQQPVPVCYQICPEDSKEIMLESSSVNNSSLGTDSHIIHCSCSLHRICFDRNNAIRGILIIEKSLFPLWLEGSIHILEICCGAGPRRYTWEEEYEIHMHGTSLGQRKRSSCMVHLTPASLSSWGWRGPLELSGPTSLLKQCPPELVV